MTEIVDDWTPADEFECPRCDSLLVEIERVDVEWPGPYGPVLPAVFVCAAGHRVPVATTPGYADAFDRFRDASKLREVKDA